MKSLLLFLTLISLAGRASAGPLVPSTSAKVGEAPRLNEATEKSVGEVIYETYNYQQIEGVRLTEPANVDVLAARWSLSTSETLRAYVDGKTKVYCTEQLVLFVLGTLTSRVCLTDLDNDQKFDSWKAPEGPPARRKWNKLKDKLSFSSVGAVTISMDGFRYELLYQGISGNVVSLLYREYINDLARPAFQQDLSYTLAAEGATNVSFRSTKLRILSADNNTIRYELLAGLKP